MSSLKFEHIEHFIEVCQSKSITKAAMNLFISQQALSRSIRKLEEELGHVVFHRTVQGVQLTAAGAQLYDLFFPIVKSYQSTELQYKSSNTEAIVSVYVAPGVIRNLTPELMLSYSDAHPNIKVNFIESSEKKIEQSVNEDKRRFGIISAPEWLLKAKYDYIVLKINPICILVPKSNPLSDLATVSLSMLKNERILSLSSESYYREALDKALEPFGFSVTPYFESADIMNLLGMVNRGVGVLLCSKKVYEEASVPNCTLIPVHERTFDYHTAFVFKDYSALSPLSQDYIHFIRNQPEHIIKNLLENTEFVIK